MEITLSNELLKNKIPLKVTILEIEGVNSGFDSEKLDQHFYNTIMEIENVYKIDTLAQDKQVKIIRELFKKAGTDPSRWRPSSEAMLRRILKDKSLYRINPLVDINNIISLRFRVPIGLCDIEKIAGNTIEIGIGNNDEVFIGLTGREYNAAAKLVTRDGNGIIGSPIVDSERTKITDDCHSALAIIYSHSEEMKDLSENAAKEFSGLITDIIKSGQGKIKYSITTNKKMLIDNRLTH